jgi:hypothetical protein
MGSGTERDPLIVPGYSVTAATVGTKTFVGLDRVDRALRLAHPAINAFVRVDDEHVSTGHTSTQSMVLQRMQLSLTT